QVTCIGKGDTSVVGKKGGEGSHESIGSPAGKAGIQLAKQDHRIVRLLCYGSNGPNHHGDEHCGGKAFARDIANDEEQAGVIHWKDLKEIAAYLARGLVDGVNDVSGNRLV